MSQPQSVDVSTLSLEQLSEIRKQLEAEVDHLSQGSAEIRQVLAKFMDCSQSVKQASERAQSGADLMVPSTQSSYVPGRMEDGENFLVDIGTNYYVEKNSEDAAKFFDNKVTTLSKNLVDIEKSLKDKVSVLRNMDTVYKQKFSEHVKKTMEEREK